MLTPRSLSYIQNFVLPNCENTFHAQIWPLLTVAMLQSSSMR